MTIYPPVKVGVAEVYFSGTFICRTGQIIEITPSPNVPTPYRLRVSFIESALGSAKVVVENEPDKVVRVTVTNFGSEPSSTISPANVGKLDGLPLLLDIAGYATGEGSTLVRVVTLTILKGRP